MTGRDRITVRKNVGYLVAVDQPLLGQIAKRAIRLVGRCVILAGCVLDLPFVQRHSHVTDKPNRNLQFWSQKRPCLVSDPDI